MFLRFGSEFYLPSNIKGTSKLPSLIAGRKLNNVAGPFILQDIYGLFAVAFGYMALRTGVCWFAGNMFNRVLLNANCIKIIKAALNISLITAIASIMSVSLGYNKASLFIVPIFICVFYSELSFPIRGPAPILVKKD